MLWCIYIIMLFTIYCVVYNYVGYLQWATIIVDTQHYSVVWRHIQVVCYCKHRINASILHYVDDFAMHDVWVPCKKSSMTQCKVCYLVNQPQTRSANCVLTANALLY